MKDGGLKERKLVIGRKERWWFERKKDCGLEERKMVV